MTEPPRHPSAREREWLLPELGNAVLDLEAEAAGYGGWLPFACLGYMFGLTDGNGAPRGMPA